MNITRRKILNSIFKHFEVRTAYYKLAGGYNIIV